MITLLTTIADIFLPVLCAGCGADGEPLCVRCSAAFDGPFPVDRPTTEHGPRVHALAEYGGVARTVLLNFKERGRRDLAGPLGRMMAAVLPTLDGAARARDGTWWLVPAPSRPRAARNRGGPHMLALARRLAAALASQDEPAAVAPALRLGRGVRDSAGLSAADRVANVQGRMRVAPAGLPPPGTPVVLLDDVVTTGATAAACTEALETAGLEVTAMLTLTATV